jgi:hypothetical protein
MSVTERESGSVADRADILSDPTPMDPDGSTGLASAGPADLLAAGPADLLADGVARPAGDAGGYPAERAACVGHVRWYVFTSRNEQRRAYRRPAELV